MKFYRFLILLALTNNFMFANKAKEVKKENKEVKESIDVYVTDVKKSEIYDPLVYGGVIQSKVVRSVVSEITGVVSKLRIVNGAYVHRGQSLAILKPAGTGSNYNNYNIISPISGFVTTIDKKQGEFVGKGGLVFIIESPVKLQITINVPNADLHNFETKTPINALNLAVDKQIAATVSSIYPKADFKTGTFPVRLDLQCGKTPKICKKFFKLGTIARIVLKKNIRQGYKIRIGHTFKNNSEVLTISKDNKAKWLKIMPGKFYGKYVEVLEGLKGVKQIVKTFAKRPKDGDTLVIVNEEKKKNNITTKIDKNKKSKI